VHIEGRAALDYPAYRKLVWASGKSRLLKLWAAVLLVAVGALLLTPVLGSALLIAFLVAAPAFFELSLRRVWPGWPRAGRLWRSGTS
jgi:hypothetical protein